MAKKKKIVTQKVKRLKIIDRLVWLVPVLIFVNRIIHEPAWSQSIVECFRDSLAAGIGVLVVIAFALTVLSAPIVLTWRAISHTLKKSAIKDTTFNVLQDFDYYRDRLTGLSPTDVSMLTDLEIESKKDITALILKYTMMGVVSTDGNEISVLNMEHPDLLESDRILLRAFRKGGMDVATIVQWKEMAKEETVRKGYLSGNRQDPRKGSQGCFTASFTGCLTPILIFIACFFLGQSDIYSKFVTFVNSLSDDMSNLEVIKSTLAAAPDTSFSVFVCCFMVVMILVAFLLPFVSLIYYIVRQTSSKRYKRTELGEELTEEIYGMKNFIHDFSNLSNVDKEQLVLWDDFLIYAVLLEENMSIVDEICRMKQVNIVQFNVMHKDSDEEF